MLDSILADAVLVTHLLFVVFAVGGGFLLLHRRAWIWAHLPAACWAALIEFAGWICPLTPLENWFRLRAGQSAYETGFVERYLTGLIYPAGLTRGMQILLGVFVVAVNAAIYAWVLAGRRGSSAGSRQP